jgi:hypothetical protein
MSQELAKHMPAFGEIVVAQMHLDIPPEAVTQDLEEHSYQALY